MSYTKYNADNMTIELIGESEIAAALGDLKKKTPAVIKSAVNSTARDGRKLMVKQAKAKYAVNAVGRKHLDQLKLRKKAKVTDLGAELGIGGPSQRSGMKNDLGYFKDSPSRAFMGLAVYQAPKFFKAKVLKKSSMKKLTGKGNLSKGFLLTFSSGHVGMVQRVIGSSSKNTITNRGKPRWANSVGNVEKVRTMGSPSAVAMHKTVWGDVEPDVEEMLDRRLKESVQKTIARAAARKAR
jgi:hypothetical protein